MPTLVTIAPGHQLAAAPAAAYLRARAAGAPPGITSSYRTNAEQRVLYAKWLAGKGASAAVPGTSVHEKAGALDLPDEDENPRAWPHWAEYGWVRTNAEEWHREYRASSDQHLTDAAPAVPAPITPTITEAPDMLLITYGGVTHVVTALSIQPASPVAAAVIQTATGRAPIEVDANGWSQLVAQVQASIRDTAANLKGAGL